MSIVEPVIFDQSLMEERDYWLQKLSGEAIGPNFTQDYDADGAQSGEMDIVELNLPDHLSRRLNKVCGGSSFLVYTMMMAALKVCLHKHTGREIVVVGSPALKEMSGSNALAIVDSIDLRLPFRQFLFSVRETLLEAYARQRYPLSNVVEDLGLQWADGKCPLFDVVLLLNDIHGSLPAVGSDLLIMLDREEETISGSIEFNRGQFTRDTIEQFGRHLVNVLNQGLEDSETPLGRLDILTQADRQKLLAEWSKGQADYSSGWPIHSLFEGQVERTPDAAAIVCDGESVTYAQLNARANRVAHHLRTLGVEPDVRVAICLERSLDMIVGLLGILKAGGSYVPLDPAYPAERLRYMLDDCSPMAVLTHKQVDAGVREALAESGAPLIDVDEIARRESIAAQNPGGVGLKPGHVAYVIYTSGSTGKPKGVMVNHGNVTRLFAATHVWFDFDQKDVWTLFHSFAFDFSVWEIWGALLYGGRLVVVPQLTSRSPQDFYRLLSREGVTILNQTPSAFRQLIAAQAESEERHRLRCVVFGGEALEVASLKPWYENNSNRQTRMINMYGITETTVHVTYRPLEPADTENAGNSPIGSRIPDLKVYVLDGAAEPLPAGIVGEMYVGGAGVARGYLNRPELTADRFTPDPFPETPGARIYRTGDLARYLPGRRLEFLGRNDSQVKIRGFRIELGEIEARLAEHPGVQDARVLVRQVGESDKRLVAYIVPSRQRACAVYELLRMEKAGVGAADGFELPNGDVAAQPEEEKVWTNQESLLRDLQTFLRERVPDYMVPASLVLIDEMPLTTNGKLDLNALPAPDRTHFASEEETVEPRTEAERILADIWAEVLGLEKVGINDNFFKIGGDSIIAIQIIARANRAGLKLSAQQIFRHQTIAEMAEAAGTNVAIESEQGIVTGAVPLTPIQHWFFEQDLPDRHHFNQAVLLEVSRAVDAHSLEKVVRSLVTHHDALRLRFFKVDSGWSQFNSDSYAASPFVYMSLTHLPEEGRVQAMEEAIERLQSSIDLSEGPLLRVALFDLGEGSGARLFIAINHLAVDGVSWRILIEDLEAACQQVSRGEEISLPPKTTSFKQWAESLAEYADGAKLSAEREYWTSTFRTEARALPVDSPEGQNSNASARKFTVSLDVEETAALLREAPRAYRTQIGDVLLTAVAQAFSEWTDQGALLIDMEGHGREEIIEKLDLSRTVGWFTTVYPTLLKYETGSDSGDALKAVKEQLRSIPNRGIGYGLLRYISGDEGLREQLQAMPEAEVSFNYLGQFDSILARSSLFKPAAESSGRGQSSRGKRRHLIDINASIASGRLQATWTYSADVHRDTTIERLAEGFKRSLCEIIAHCQSQEAAGFTPSDFPLATLTQPELDRLARSYPQIEDLYPLTPFQKGLLFHSLLSPETKVYFLQMGVRINSVLDAAAFEQSWRKVVQRHPVLRTAFVWEGLDEPMQVVHQEITLPWSYLDWRGPGEDQQARLEAFLEEDRERGLKLAEAPLMRLTLIRLADDEYEFVWTFHHLLHDGWALYLVVKDLFALYDALTQGRDLQLKKAPPFRDYIEWLQKQDPAAGEAFWKKAIKGMAAQAPLGDRHVIDPSVELEQGNQRVRLSAESTARLRVVAKEHYLTMNTFVQAAWALALSIESGEKDVVFGATVSGRPADLEGVESIVGPFINTLPVRVRIQPEGLLLPWLKEIQTQQIEARQYEYTPLVQVQSWSDLPKGKSLFESLLLFENYPVDESVQREGRKLRITDITMFDRANYPLSVFAMPGEDLSLRMAYDKRRFDDATISRMLGHLLTALESMASRADGRILDLPLLTEHERNELLVEWNSTAKTFPNHQCIHELFEAQAASTPDRVAAVFNDAQLTYGELNSRANQLARHLRDLGVRAEERVALCIDRSLEMVIGLVGILKAGGSYVPIDPNYPIERVSFMLEDAQPPVIVTKEAQLDELPATWAQPVCMDSDWEAVAQQPVDNPGCITAPENVAYIIYTSGSTGTPKGVLVTHTTLVNSTTARFDYYAPVDSFVLLSSFAFDSSVAGIFWTLCQGGALILPEENGQKDPQNVVGMICRQQASHLLTVPSYYTQLLSHSGPAQFRSLNTAIIAGESWPKELLERHVQLNPRAHLYNEYGPTEGTVWSSVFEAKPDDKRSTVPIGRPIANVKIYLLDSHLNPVPVAAPGQVYLGGDGLARGYYGHPELTARKFIPNAFGESSGERLYCTGDLARYLPDGNIEFLGRTDQQVKIRGYRIELEEIEAVLRQMPMVHEAVVAAREDVPGDKRLVGYVIPDEGCEPSVGEFRRFLDQKLPGYMVPSAFVFLDSLPLSPNGKVDRRALPAPDQSRPKLETEFAEPRTDLERLLAGIWSKVLQVEKVGLDDNFFELGGDSILSIQLLSKAREQGLNLTLQQIFRHQTIAQLVREVAGSEAGPDEVLATKPFDLISEEDRLKLAEDVEDAYPLSMLQAGMIFHSELSTETAAYHSINSARLRGPLDVQTLMAAAQSVVDRHPIFRTSFHLSGYGDPMQFVHRSAAVALEADDLRSLSPAEQERALAEWLEAEKLRHFDWTRPPLLRLHVQRLTDDTFNFAFTAHHAIIDGWSDSLFLTELFRRYSSLLQGWSDSAETPPVSTFRDYVALEREALQSEECRRYWADKLADCSITPLPRRPRSSDSENASAYYRLSVAVPDEISAGLRELANSIGVSFKSVLLAAHLRVMSLLAGQSDVITGLVSNGRSESADGDQVIGLFLNTLPFRQELSGGEWIDLIKKTFEGETEMLPHRRYPLAQIQRNLGGRSLFESCFNFVHFQLFKSIQESREIEVLSTKAVAETNYPLITHFASGISSASLGIALDCDLREISEEQVEAIAGYYSRVLEEIVRDPHQRYECCPLLSAEERKRVLTEWNDTNAYFPQDRCMHELFEEEVRRSPAVIAVSCEGRELTYAELNLWAGRLAGALVAQGVGPDSIVPVLTERGPELLASILGIFKAGGAYLPLDPRHPENRLLQIIRQSEARLVLASAQFHSDLGESLGKMPEEQRPRLLSIETLLEADEEQADAGLRSKPGDLAYVIYTSGSTGIPKGAMVEHIGMLNHLYAKVLGLGLGSQDVVAQTASQCFDISVWQFLAALLVGGRVEIFKDDVAHDASRLMKEVEAQAVTILETVPSLLNAMLDSAAASGERPELPLLRWMVPTGEALPPELCRRWLRLYPRIPLLNAYGPTECSDDVTHYPITEPPDPQVQRIPIGRPVPNARIYILDDWLSPVPVGVIGELCVGGVCVGRGYLNDEVRTSEAFLDDPFAPESGARLYKTGDLARYRPDGKIEFLGRKDHQVKVRGFRIELQEIEEALRREAGVRDAAVVTVGEDSAKRLIGYVVMEEGRGVRGGELRKAVGEKLPDYMVPSVIEELGEMPLTSNGKIDRKALEGRELREREGEVEEEGIWSATEEIVGGIWSEVLGVERIGKRENFFELGGHSLLATQVVSRIREGLEVEIGLRKLFEEPTVEGLSREIEETKREAKGLRVPDLERWREERGEAPASYAQQRLWVLNQMDPGSAAYNIPAGVRIEGRLNEEAFEASLNEVVRRHGTLRTRFRAQDGEPIQEIEVGGRIGLRYVDLTSLEHEEKEEIGRRLGEEEGRRGFDLERGPVVRAALVKMGEEEHLGLMTTHHIVSDGWSRGVMIGETAKLYEAYRGGKASPLEELEIEYQDYARWQREWMSGEVYEGEIGYWREQLGGMRGRLELPTDRPRAAVQSLRGGTERKEYGGEIVEGLRKLSRREGVTLYMMLLAAFQVLMHRYSGQREIAVGSPIAGRGMGELEKLIGFFVNTLVMKVEIGEEATFREVLREVKEAALGAYSHQEMPFEKVVEELNPERSLSYTPIFQVMFALQNAPAAGIEAGELKLRWEEIRSGSTKFDLMLDITEVDGGIVGRWEYCADLFDEETIRRMGEHYGRLLKSIVEAPDTKVRDLEMLAEEEREEIEREWNRTGMEESEKLIVEMFEEEVEKKSDATAVVKGEQRVSYGELNRRANRIARYLRKEGVRAEELVGIYMERSVEMVEVMVGILKAGGGYVPLDRRYPRKRLEQMVNESGVLMVMTQGHLEEEIEGVGARLVKVDEIREEIEKEREENLERETGERNLAYVLYTSGSTGQPKGVAIEQRSVAVLSRWAEESYGKEKLEGVLASTSICFDLSVFELLVTLSQGGKVVLVENGLELTDEMSGMEVRLVNTVPSVMKEIKASGKMPSRVRTVNLAGEQLPKELIEELYEQEGIEEVINLYGPSEDTTYSTYGVMERRYEERAPIGRPIGETQIYIVDGGMKAVGVGIKGEIYIGGQGQARGYVNRPELTAERFVPDPFSEEGGRLYQTGDVGRYLKDGEIEYLGRKDHQVKVRGFRIELQEIETVIRALEGVQEAAVVVREAAGGDKRLIGYVVMEEGRGVRGGELRKAVGEKLPDYMVPSVIEELGEMPLTSNGKIDRKALEGRELREREGEVEEEGIWSATEEIVGGIWSEVLGVERIGKRENFFELGGHSLLATQVVSRIREGLEVEIGLRKLFEEPTVEGLSREIEETKREAKGLRVPDLERWREERGEAPASYAQQRLWVLNQMDPGSAAYNIPAGVRIEGRLNEEAFEASLNEVVRRHGTLRTRFRAQDGEPIQEIEVGGRIGLRYVDLTSLEHEEKEEIGRRLGEEEGRRGFDLERGPVVRAALVKMGEEEHLGLMTTHHIVSDGWSRGVMIGETAKLYEAYRGGKASPLEELEIEYQDYARWQREWMSGEVYEGEIGYWREQLGGMRGRLELPTDRPRAAVQSLRGGTERKEYGGEIVEGLRKLSRREGVTLYMMLLAAFQVLMHRYSGQREIAVGSPIAGRGMGELEKLIGFFVNTLVMKVEIGEEATFREVLREVKEAALGAYSHQEMPFEKVVEELNPERSLSYTPIFQVMFALQNAPAAGIEAGELKLRWEEIRSGSTKFDLMLDITEVDGGIVGRWEYCADLFDEETIRRMGEHYGRLLKSIVEAPDTKVRDLEMLAEEEREEIEREWNRTGMEESEKLIVEMFEEEVEKKSDATAVVKGEQRVSYGELNRRANRIARYLRKEGVRAEELVGIYMERSVEMVEVMVGILKAGGGYVPLDRRYPRKRLEQMVNESGVLMVMTQGHLEEEIEGVGARLVKVDEIREEIEKEREENLERETGERNLAYVLYTSGSTGQPKGVAIEQRSVAVLSRWAEESYGKEKLEGVLASTSICFDLSVFELLVTLSQGGKVVLVENGLELTDEMSGMEVRLVNTVPSVMKEIKASGKMPSRVRTVNLAGEQLPKELIEELYEQEGIEEVINLYGPSEDTTYSTYGVMERRYEERAPIGRPIGETQIYIVDGGMKAVGVGIKGEIYIGGQGQARGYVNRPELTAERFVPDPFSEEGGRLYQTGDVGRYLRDGEIEYLGRKDHQVKVRGFRIELQEIETVIRALEGVQEAAVVVREAAGGDKRLIGYVVMEEGRGVRGGELRKAVGEKLPDYMVPSVIEELGEMPLTSNGKIDRKALEGRELREREGEVEEEGIWSATEEIVGGIWSEVLGVERIGKRENFFELGGHSLLATRAISRLRECFGLEIPLRSIFEFPSLMDLAESIDKALIARSGLIAPPIRRVSRDGDLPLSFAQQRLWLADQLIGESAVYNMPFAARLRHGFNASALEQALSEIIRRHESLRTNFVAADGEAMQVIRPASQVSLRCVDLRGAEAAEEQIRALMKEEARHRFDLECDPLIRATLMHLDDGESIVLCSMHHIISDGWSMEVLAKELTALNEAFSNGRPSPLEDLSIQYADFAHWQQGWLKGEVLQDHLDYWVRQLGDSPGFSLETDRPRPAVPTYKSREQSFTISGGVSESLKAMSRREGVTMFMTLLAAFQTLLYRYSNQEDLVVGTAIANRNRAETEGLIGFFVNLLPLRTNLSGNPTFTELLARVRDVALGAYAHQDLPFEKLVQELRPDRDPRANPLVQSVLTYRNAVQPSDSGAQFQVIEIDKGTSPFDLLLSVTEARDGLSAAVSYATDLFADHTIERLMSRFVVLLDAIAQDPNQRISDIRLTARNEADELKISRFAKLKLSQKDMESLLDQVSEVLQ